MYTNMYKLIYIYKLKGDTNAYKPLILNYTESFLITSKALGER